MLSSWRALQLFAATAEAWLAGHPGETRAAYAIGRVKDQITRYGEKLQGRLTDIEIDLCVVNEKDVVQRDGAGALQFTREGLKERNRRQLELLEELVEIEPFFLASVPADMTPQQLEVFRGLIIREEVADAPADEVPAMLAASGALS